MGVPKPTAYRMVSRVTDSLCRQIGQIIIILNQQDATRNKHMPCEDYQMAYKSPHFAYIDKMLILYEP